MLVNQLQLMSLSDTGRPVMGLVSKGSCTLGWVASLTFNTMFILNHWIFLLLKLSGFLASAFFLCNFTNKYSLSSDHPHINSHAFGIPIVYAED